MDGLSIKEAANILGVPKGRVWELIARGVLVGTPEGGGMRVYLHGKRAEALPAPRVELEDEKPRHANGNGGSGHEASPFREILTEFRNLTERYGQALLALGEARGEVAALRSRVELLEARIDLRLPPAPPFVSWSPPQEAPAMPGPAAEEAAAEPSPPASVQAEPEPEAEPMAAEAEPTETMASDAELIPAPMTAETAPEPASASQGESVEDAEADDESERRTRAHPRLRPRHRRRASRRTAMEGIAMALARADDPSDAELPGADEAGVAFSAYRAALADEAAPEARDEGPDQVVATDAVATSEPIPDAFLGDDALGGLLTDEALPTTEPSVVAPAIVEEPAHEELGIEAMSPRDEAPLVEAPVVETPMYSSEWDEPDWIAEEDLDSWDLARQADAVQAARHDEESRSIDEPVDPAASVEVPVEIGAAAAPPEPPTTAAASTHAAEEFVSDAIEDAFAEPAPFADTAAVEADAEEGPPMPAGSETFVASGEEAWPAADDVMLDQAQDETPVEPTEAPVAHEPAPEAASESDVLEAVGEAEIFPTDPTEVMNALVESGAAVPASEPMVAEPAEPAEAAEPAEPAEPAEAAEPAERAEAAEPEAGDPWSVVPPVTDAAAPDAGAEEAGPQNAALSDGDEEELMWLGDEFAPDPRRGGLGSSAPTAPITPAEDRALNQLAAERGWDDSELRAIRSLLAQPTTSTLDAPTEDAPASDAATGDAPVEDAMPEDVPLEDAPAAVSPPTAVRTDVRPTETDPPAPHAGLQMGGAGADLLEPEDEVMDWEQSPTAWIPPAGASSAFELPGALELDEALAAVSRRPGAPAHDQSAASVPVPEPTGSDQAAPADGATETAGDAAHSWSKPVPALDLEPSQTETTPSGAGERGATSSPGYSGDEDWLAGRRGPAANAYRRLRRLFPR